MARTAFLIGADGVAQGARSVGECETFADFIKDLSVGVKIFLAEFTKCFFPQECFDIFYFPFACIFSSETFTVTYFQNC